MGRYKFGIVSYRRPDKQFMLDYLVSLGYQRDDIIIQTQDEDDFRQYDRLFSDWATVLYKKGTNVSENKNNLIEWYNQHCGKDTMLVICSDKVRSVMFLGGDGKLHKMNRVQFDVFLERAFTTAQQLGASLFGVYPVKNAFFMSHSTHINQFLLGCFMGICNSKDVEFDANQPLKEDWEVMLRTIYRGGCVVRYNDVALDASFRTAGGCHEEWNTEGRNAQCTRRLLEIYPSLVKRHATRKDELKYVGWTEKINKSILTK